MLSNDAIKAQLINALRYWDGYFGPGVHQPDEIGPIMGGRVESPLPIKGAGLHIVYWGNHWITQTDILRASGQMEREIFITERTLKNAGKTAIGPLAEIVASNEGISRDTVITYTRKTLSVVTDAVRDCLIK